jgi:TetR/AcrR family transcriptional regulator of autoinduction and epiphytic fitness
MRASARELFVRQGYTATTMDEIASQAGVAVQTVYYTFRTKGALLCELMDVTAAGGEDPPPVAERPWMREAMASPSAQRALALTVEHGTAIFERAAPLWPAINAAAASDPAVGEYWRGVTTRRRAGQRALVIRLAELGALRTGLGVERGTDIMVLLHGHDAYTALVEAAGWSIAAYQAWLFATLARQLLETHGIEGGSVEDLSYGELVAEWMTEPASLAIESDGESRV